MSPKRQRLRGHIHAALTADSRRVTCQVHRPLLGDMRGRVLPSQILQYPHGGATARTPERDGSEQAGRVYGVRFVPNEYKIAGSSLNSSPTTPATRAQHTSVGLRKDGSAAPGQRKRY